MKSVLDRSFQYNPRGRNRPEEDVCARRRQLKEQQKERLLAESEAKGKVSPIKSGRIIASV